MKVYTYSEARQSLAKLLDQVVIEGAVQITRRDGQVFTLTATPERRSPLDVPSLNVRLSDQEIVDLIREGREDDARYLTS